MTVEFTYANGVVQVKRLISHNFFINVIKPAKEKLNQLSLIQDKKLTKEDKQEILDYKNMMSQFDDEWCTDKSPLGLSIFTKQLILSENQGGKQEIRIRILK